MARKKPTNTNRTHVNGSLAVQARKALGMTQEELAGKEPRVSVGTISKIERSEVPSNRLIHLVAQKLGLTYEQLTSAKGKAPPAKTSKKLQTLSVERYDDGRVTVTISVDVAPSDDPEKQARELFVSIAKFVHMKDRVNPGDINVKTGSLHITVPLSKRDADSLYEAFRKLKLKKFGVTSLQHGDFLFTTEMAEANLEAAKQRRKEHPYNPQQQLDMLRIQMQYPDKKARKKKGG